MKKVLLLLFLIAMTAPWAQAQQNDENVYVEQVQVTENPQPKISGKQSEQGYTETQLFGKYSLIPLLKNLAADATLAATIRLNGDNNSAKIVQKGQGNAGMIKIKGDNNKTKLAQTGSSLFSILNINGFSNTFNINQKGTGLENYIQVTGSGIRMNAEQTAAGMKLMQAGGNAIPLQIKSTGHLIPIIITNH
jgi:hypothetical protein